MANQDNPIFNVIENVLGFNGKPKSFSDKIDRLQVMVEGKKSLDRQYQTLLPLDSKGISLLGESYRARTVEESTLLFNKLSKAGIVPHQAKDLFQVITKHGGNVFYDERNGNLFFGSESKIRSLPTIHPNGGTILNRATRLTNSIMLEGSTTPISYAEAFYTEFDKLNNVNSLGAVFKGLKQVNKTPLNSAGATLNSLLVGTTSFRGKERSEVNFFRENLYMIPGSSAANTIYDSTAYINKTFATLVKTAGGVIDSGISELGEASGKMSSSQAFARIHNLREQNLVRLGNFLKDNNALNSYVFVKPEYLGSKKKLLMANPVLNNIYGMHFEEHTLAKGLYQVANMASTTQTQMNRMLTKGINPFNTFVTEGQVANDPFAMFRELNFNVGVIDFANEAYAKSIVNEGGFIITQSGAAKLGTTMSMGTVNLTNFSEAQVGAAERLFGVNLGAEKEYTLNNSLGFNRQEFSRARDYRIDEKELTSIEKDIRTLTSGSSKYSGVWEQVVSSQGKIGKIQITDAGLRMDFLTAGDTIAPSMEMILGTRRGTGIFTSEGHVLHGSLGMNELKGVDLLIGADEFHKMLGPRVYIQNFVENIQKLNNSEQVFNQAFKGKIRFQAPPSGTSIKPIPIITDATSAYELAKRHVENMKAEGNAQMKELALKIEHGNKVITDQLLSKGIKGITTFNIGGALRNDFMADINMIKPLRFTASKMVTMASGARQLGYSDAYEDPMFKLLTRQNVQWEAGHIGVRSGSGDLYLGKKNIARQFGEAMMGRPTLHANNVVTLGQDGFYANGTKLKALPTDMHAFSHSAGGVPLEDLKGTVLDPIFDIRHLDLGGKKRLNLTGVEQEYSHLPISPKFLRADKAYRGNVVVASTNPAYEMFDTLIKLEHNNGFHTDPIKGMEKQLGSAYAAVARSMSGKKGLFNVTSTILVPSGTRVRIVPSVTGYHTFDNFTDPSKLFDAVIPRSQFEDYLVRKRGVARKQVSKIAKAYEKNGFLYGMVSVDPMQRSEHANVFRLRIAETGNSAKIGQLNLEMHAGVLRMFERDTDRDVANLVFLDGLFTGKAGDKAIMRQRMEERILKQQELSKHFLWFYKYQLMHGKQTGAAANRLSAMTLIKDKIEEHLGVYIGTPKSLGYTITRATDSLMGPIVGYGTRGASQLGILGKNGVTSEMIEQIRAPFLKDGVMTERYAVSQKLLQNFFQGAVQKGATNKGELIEFAEGLVGIGQKYKGAAFDHGKIVEETQEITRKFLQSSSKERHFMALDYMHKEGILDRTTVDAVKADLERGLATTLDDAAQQRISKYFAAALDASSRIIAERLGPAMALAATTRRGIRNVQSVIQNITEKGEELKKFWGPISGTMTPRSANNVAGKATSTIIDKIADQAAKSKSFLNAEGLGKFFATDNGHFFAGLGVGAIATAAIIGLHGGPEAPMPRDIDSRQPTDTGPEIYSKPPRIYGTNQNFYASQRRSPETFSPVGRYSFSAPNNSSITIRDKRSPTNPYLLEQQMKQVANSDYNY
jgi:hypothetical protein